MKVSILQEAGFEKAMFGLALSYGTTVDRAIKVSKNLAFKDHGHNKFLESIDVWLDVTAPRYWWQEADTYRLTTKQSESTIHSLNKKKFSQEDFEKPIPEFYLNHLNELLKDNSNFAQLKNDLPEGYLQRRIWKVSYKTLREILIQRSNHKLAEWKYFCDVISKETEHCDLLIASTYLLMERKE